MEIGHPEATVSNWHASKPPQQASSLGKLEPTFNPWETSMGMGLEDLQEVMVIKNKTRSIFY